MNFHPAHHQICFSVQTNGWLECILLKDEPGAVFYFHKTACFCTQQLTNASRYAMKDTSSWGVKA